MPISFGAGVGDPLAGLRATSGVTKKTAAIKIQEVTDTVSTRASVPTSQARDALLSAADALRAAAETIRVGGTPPALTEIAAFQEVNTQTKGPGTATSAAAIGLDVTDRYSTLGSTAEINTAPTSYTDILLDLNLLSTSNAELTGVYTGTGVAASATSLKLTIQRNKTISATPTNNVKFNIKDQNGTVLYQTPAGDIDNYVAGQQIYLGADIGLSIAFTAGTLVNGAIDTTAASNVTPTDVDPNQTFQNADVNLRPRFENGAQVTAGSFTVNGQNISVLGTDTINTVIGKINAAGAGVTASFAGDKVTLTSNSYSESAITVGGDTSGFLAAVKLSGATSVVGNLNDRTQVIQSVPAFSTVSTGSFSVNGVSISVDKTTDTLQTVLDRVSASAANVQATYNATTDQVNFVSTNNSDIVFASDTSGLLAELNIAQTTYVGPPGAVNANAAFNGTGVNSPYFDTGIAVTAGVFTINDIELTVDADDTVNSVLAKITNSAAGVAATYDSSTDKVTLAITKPGVTSVDFENDTSGFLKAVKLEDVNPTTETEFLDETLTDVPGFTAITNGSITVNGQSVAINPDNMTLQDALSALDALEGVVATSTETDQGIRTRIQLSSGTLGASDNTGLLAALGVAAANLGANKITDTEKLITPIVPAPVNAQAELESAVNQVDSSLSLLAKGDKGSDALRDDLLANLRTALTSLKGSAAGAVALTQGARPGFLADSAQLREALKTDSDSILKFLDEAEGGLRASVTTSADSELAEAMTPMAEPAPEPIEQPFEAKVLQLDADLSRDENKVAALVNSLSSLSRDRAAQKRVDVSTATRARKAYSPESGKAKGSIFKLPGGGS